MTGPRSLGVKGLLIQQTFDFLPDPPARDTLGNPLTVAKVPLHLRPQEPWPSRWGRILSGAKLSRGSPINRARWRLQDAITSVLVSIGAAPLPPNSAGGPVRKVQVHHPYHLKPAFDLLVTAPPPLHLEANFLEMVLGLVLRSHADGMATLNRTSFSFAEEAREYFQEGYKAERLLRDGLSSEEFLSLTQKAYHAYYHGRYYYLFALIGREKGSAVAQMFNYFYRSCHFMARVSWDGELLARPSVRNLPSRAALMFHLRRDRVALARIRGDRAFAEQVTGLLKSLPP